MLAFVKNASLGFFESLNLFRRQRRRFGGDTIKRAAAGDAINFQAGRDFELEQLQVAQADFFTGRVERGAQQILRALDQGLQLVVIVGNAGDALIRLDTDQKRSAVGIGHAGENADYLAGELLFAFLLAAAAAVLEGADEFKKLAALLFEQKSDFFCLHGFIGQE